eukprot:1143993-Pelagomonas_calceolata.AAC.2
MKCQHQKACLLQKISYGMVVHVFGIDNGSKAFVRSLILCQKWMIYCRADLNPILGLWQALISQFEYPIRILAAAAAAAAAAAVLLRGRGLEKLGRIFAP